MNEKTTNPRRILGAFLLLFFLGGMFALTGCQGSRHAEGVRVIEFSGEPVDGIRRVETVPAPN